MLYIRETKSEIKPPFLSDGAYAEARQCLPFVATDAVIADIGSKTIYLAWRQATPARGWWVIGGGVKNGQAPAAAMAKSFARETSLVLPADRFEALPGAVNFTQWTVEEQISNLHIPFKVELTEAERATAQANLEQKEYEGEKGLRAFDLDDLLAAIENGTGYPQPVLYYDAIFGTDAHQEALARWQELRAS